MVYLSSLDSKVQWAYYQGIEPSYTQQSGFEEASQGQSDTWEFAQVQMIAMKATKL
jgi:hypothetical protein